MNDRPRRTCRTARWVLLFTLAAGAPSAAAHAEPRAADAATSPVLLVGPPDARLLVQIRRELAASGFPVIERPAEPGADPTAPPGALPAGAGAAVVVERDDHLRVWALDGPGAGLRLRADLVVDRADPHARRRVSLAVVEYLRFGAADEPLAPTDHGVEAPPRLAPVSVAALDLLTTGALTDAMALASAEASGGPPPATRPWGLGAATTLNFDSGIGEPTSHVQLTAQLPMGERWAITVTGLWPLLGAQFQTDGQYVRMWTVGATGGLRYALPRPLPRVQPFVGVALGARFVLSDSESMETRQSRVVFTPSATVGGNAGLLVELRPLIHLLLEGNVAWMGLVPLGPRTPFEAAAARGRAAHAALGVLFEY